MASWHCKACGALWPSDPGTCPCSGTQTFYVWGGNAQSLEDARQTAFEAYYANYAVKRLEAELQIEGD